MKILLAEDEVTIAVTLRDALEEAGYAVVTAETTEAALAALEAELPDLVITDVRMPGEGGHAVLERSLELQAERPVIVMTGFATIDKAVEAMRLGAVDYVQKPFRNDAMVARVDTLARLLHLQAENDALRGEGTTHPAFAGIIGTSPAMRAVFERVETVATSEATVLIQGESGTGKERIAQAVHKLSGRSQGPFVALSCAALPESLLEAELFGHEKGAFTDARKTRRGRFELAQGGTLFLDDIDDMPLPTQVKLLRVLQERSFERVGGEETLEADIRVVVATKVDLLLRVRDGRFREDLYYRVHVVPLELPPLRERPGDVPALVRHMIARFGAGRTYRVARSTMNALERYPWPGNVRELENAVQRAIALSGENEVLAAEDLLTTDPRWRGANQVPEPVRPLRDVLKEAEEAHLRAALQATGGHRTQTAELLGISRKVLWEKLREHGISDGAGE
ncbi:MAG: sigma-54-dependent Fis family transcriptional regulator [Planctomycetes bacterium]|nr:sigma-54-dependent Fis family transcriptional regulator [Planctomycetota bacterium]HPF14343.1 sigma-54 dependent transcriptional regulator [Planctomycetota bacterium]